MTRIADLLGGSPTLSYEFFPPRTEAGRQTLTECLEAIRPLGPSFVSVTYGAGGSTRETTRAVVLEIGESESYPAMPHLTCTGHSVADLTALVDDYVAHGIENLLALAGDPIPDAEPIPDELHYASELVELVRARHDLSVAVSAFPEGHPRSPDLATDRRYLAAKLERADLGLSQFFFRADDFLRMRDDLAALGCDTPVLPGVMPLVNPEVVRRFAAINGAWFPEDLAARVTEAGDDAVAVAVESAVALADRLLDEGVPGVHVYCLNRGDVATGVVLGLNGRVGSPIPS